MRIVPAFDVAEEDQARVRVRREAMLREAFTFERRERDVVLVLTAAKRNSP